MLYAVAELLLNCLLRTFGNFEHTQFVTVSPLTPTVAVWSTAVKHRHIFVSDLVKQSFVIFDTRALRSEHQSARMSEITNDSLTRCGAGCSISVPHMATVGIKG